MIIDDMNIDIPILVLNIAKVYTITKIQGLELNFFIQQSFRQ